MLYEYYIKELLFFHWKQQGISAFISSPVVNIMLCEYNIKELPFIDSKQKCI